MLNHGVKDAGPAVLYAVPPMETMGDRIKLLREARGLTQNELADICGVTKSAVSQWESGITANVKLPTFLKLLKALSTDFEYLVFGPLRGAERSGEGPDDSSPSGKFRKPRA